MTVSAEIETAPPGEARGKPALPTAIAPPLNGVGSDDLMGGQKGVANWINLNYQGRLNTWSGLVNAMAISRWLRGTNLPAGCREFFPAPAASGRFSKAKAGAWVEKYLLKVPALTPTGEPAQQDSPPPGDMTDWADEWKKERALLARRQRVDYEKAHDDRYILLSEHEESMVRALKVTWSHFCRLVEVDLIAGLTDAVERGLSPQQILADARLRHEAGIDAMQRQFRNYGNGAPFYPGPGQEAPPPPEPGAPQSPAENCPA